MIDYTIDELMCVCLSRQIEDGELVAQGIATPLVAAGYLLAKLTHAPNLQFASAIGQAICRDWAPLGLTNTEELWVGKGIYTLDFIQAPCDFLPRFGPKEFFRPGQVDAFGNFNNVFMGGTYEQPRLRLPGSGGIADVTVFEEQIYLYVPRHGRHTFVEQLDFRSGLGHYPQRKMGAGPRRLISDLGVFDFGGANGRMCLLTHHSHTTPQHIQSKTGFPLLIADNVRPTQPPSEQELKLLREEIDPLGIRQLETLRGAHRRRKLQAILEQEVRLRDA
jgi:acyl CoA:acetate/3-ketoacid CoA transferase beta subunit